MTQALISERAERTPLLIQYLGAQAGQKNQTHWALARAVGMTYGQWQTFSQGQRSLSSLTAVQLRLIAQYLVLPPIAVWLLAGKFHPSDFHMPAVPTAQKATGLQRLFNDESVGPLLPVQALTACAATQTFLSELYEQEARRSPLPRALQPLEAVVVAMEQAAMEKEGNQ